MYSVYVYVFIRIYVHIYVYMYAPVTTFLVHWPYTSFFSPPGGEWVLPHHEHSGPQPDGRRHLPGLHRLHVPGDGRHGHGRPGHGLLQSSGRRQGALPRPAETQTRRNKRWIDCTWAHFKLTKTSSWIIRTNWGEVAAHSLRQNQFLNLMPHWMFSWPFHLFSSLADVWTRPHCAIVTPFNRSKRTLKTSNSDCYRTRHQLFLSIVRHFLFCRWNVSVSWLSLAELHPRWRAAPGAAPRPGWLLHSPNGPVHRPRWRARGPWLHVLLHGSVWRERPVNTLLSVVLTRDHQPTCSDHRHVLQLPACTAPVLLLCFFFLVFFFLRLLALSFLSLSSCSSSSSSASQLFTAPSHFVSVVFAFHAWKCNAVALQV